MVLVDIFKFPALYFKVYRDGFREIDRGFQFSIGARSVQKLSFWNPLKTVWNPWGGVPKGFMGFRGTHYSIIVKGQIEDVTRS